MPHTVPSIIHSYNYTLHGSPQLTATHGMGVHTANSYMLHGSPQLTATHGMGVHTANTLDSEKLGVVAHT